MGRTHIASANIAELKKKITECKENKRKLEAYLFDLKDKWIFKEITSSEYEDSINEKRDGKTLQEWIEFYNNYISECELQISNNKNIVDKNRKIFLTILIPIILIIILLSSLYFLKPANIIGFVIQDHQKMYVQELNINLSNSKNYDWSPYISGKLESVEISGDFEKINSEGHVKIYLDNLIILDSSQELKEGIITGSVIKQTENKKINFFEKILSFFSFKTGITGKASENNQPESELNSNQQEIPSQNQEQKEFQDSKSEENNQNSPNNKEESPQKDSSPSQQETPSSETGTKTQAETGTDTETQTSEQESAQDQAVNEPEQNAESNNETADNEDKDEIKEKTSEEKSNETDKAKEVKNEQSSEPKNSENQVNKFSNACQETCNLSELNLTKSTYTLRIEVSNANLNLKEIKYTILPLEKSEWQAEENKTEENITEINETLKEDINETEIENITKNTTSKPIFIKNIPDIEIQKNTFAIITLNNYFSNAEQYYVLQTENLSTTTYDHIIRINPDANFIGKNVLTEIENGDILNYQQNQPLTQLNNFLTEVLTSIKNQQ